MSRNSVPCPKLRLGHLLKALVLLGATWYQEAGAEELSSSSRQLLLGRRHSFKPRDFIPLWANKVGPFSNPTETYQYYDLPFCQPSDGLKYKILGMGEVMDANRMAQTPYTLPFRTDLSREILCSRTLGSKDLEQFRQAVTNEWYYQMIYDDLPLWGFVGKIDKILQPPELDVKIMMYTHLHFDIKYNIDKVIEVSLSTEESIDISDKAAGSHALPVEFTYSVQWIPTDITFDKRLQRFKNELMAPIHLEIHWFSILNSCVTVLLLVLFLGTILMRILRSDLVKYTSEEDGFDTEESGWKYLHGDVFRFPQMKLLFCAFIGTGSQLFFLAIFVFLLAMVGVFYPYNRGALYSTLLVLYALTAGIAGYIGCSYHKQMEGRESWVQTVLAICFVYCGPFFLMFCFLNTVAIVYGSTAALPFGTIVIILIIWAVITIPLTILGGIAGKNGRILIGIVTLWYDPIRRGFSAPVRTHKYPREIPDLPWYRRTLPQMIMAGFLPFSAIYVELYYIFATLWGHEVYIIWSVLAIVFFMLILVTAFVTIALTYCQLAIEDHQWWWRSFLCGGSTGLFIYGYCFHYFVMRSDMTGFMQTSFYFGYMFMVSLGFFMMLGTVGWRASLTFVRYIYKSIKSE